MAYLQDHNYYVPTVNRQRRYEPGLTAYAANNTTAMAAPFELNPDDIARLDEDISTHAFKDSGLPPPQPSPFATKYPREMYYGDKENNYRDSNVHPEVNFGLKRSDVGRLAADIASSDPYVDLSPLQLRRSTSDNAKHKVITPPTSSSPHNHMEQAKYHQPRQPLADVQVGNGNYNFGRDKIGPNSTFEEMQQVFEQRLDLIKKTEAERFATLEIEYKRQIAKLQNDLEQILQRQQNMMRIKDNNDHDLQHQLDKTKQDLRREHEQRKQEKAKYEGKIKELQSKIEDLQRRLKKYASGVEGADGLSQSGLVKKYESKIAGLQHENDQKTSDLIRQFEREKQSALQIMKTRIKSEINLLVPRIRQQCQSAFDQALTRCQEQTAQRYRDKYGGIIKKLKEEHQAEKRFVQKQAREEAEQQKTEWQRKLKARYEMKALEVKNECERKLIDRMRSTRTKPSNVSFVSDLTNSTLLSESDSASFLY